MDEIRKAAQDIVADRNKIKNTDIKCGVSITDVIETELTDKRTAVDKVIADRNKIEVDDILGAVKSTDLVETEVEPTERVLESIGVDTTGAKLSYYVGDPFDSDNLHVVGYYSDGTVEDLDMSYVTTNPEPGYTFEEPTSEYIVDVYYNDGEVDLSSSYSVEVIAPQL